MLEALETWGTTGQRCQAEPVAVTVFAINAGDTLVIRYPKGMSDASRKGFADWGKELAAKHGAEVVLIPDDFEIGVMRAATGGRVRDTKLLKEEFAEVERDRLERISRLYATGVLGIDEARRLLGG